MLALCGSSTNYIVDTATLRWMMMAIQQTDFARNYNCSFTQCIRWNRGFLRVYIHTVLFSLQYTVVHITALCLNTYKYITGRRYCYRSLRSIHKWWEWDACTESQKRDIFPSKYIHWVHCTFGIFNFDSLFHQKLQELLKIRFSWTELKIFFNCSSSLEISVESLELEDCAKCFQNLPLRFGKPH